MIDFHNHVIPNVDDGPKNIEESLEMIKVASEQGITDIVQTVHFQHPKMKDKDVSYNYLYNQMKKVQYLIDEQNLKIKMHLSAEVFYLPNLVEISTNPLVTIGNGKYMLIEFQSNIYPTGFEEQFFKLQSKNITPIIAHPERYRFIQDDINILKTWKERGYILQIDSGSILGIFGKRTLNTCRNMIKKDYVNLVGSDAHNSNKRNFNLLKSYREIALLKDTDYIEQLKINSFNVLNGKEVVNMFYLNDNVSKSFFIKIRDNITKLLKRFI